MVVRWWRSHGRALARLAAVVVIGAQVYVTARESRKEEGLARLSELRLPRTVPFELTNEADPDRVLEARFEGWVRLDGAGVEFEPNTYHLLTYARVPEAFTGRIHPEAMGFGIAAPGPSGFVIEADTVVAMRADRYGTAGQALVLPIGADFRLDGLTAADLQGRWPVVMYDLRIASGAYVSSGEFRYSEPSSVLRVYAHGDPEIFRRLLTPGPWEDDEKR